LITPYHRISNIQLIDAMKKPKYWFTVLF